jgi:hypothetical protein
VGPSQTKEGRGISDKEKRGKEMALFRATNGATG